MLCMENVALFIETNTYSLSFLEANVKNTHLVMGWGRTNNKRSDAGDRFSGGAHSNILQKLEVPLVTNEMCRSNYKSFQNITRNKQICAGGIEGIYYNILTTILLSVSKSIWFSITNKL